MAVDPFILIPLYIYPEGNNWQPLWTAASDHPNVNFTVIVNPNTGPGDQLCGGADYKSVMETIRDEYDNIQTLGYVHTATEFNCGDGGDICPTTMPIGELNKNVQKYIDWNSDECGGLAPDGIFFDESPYEADEKFISYMDTAVEYVRTNMPDAKIMFNAGTYVEDPRYWEMADWICALENDYSAYEDERGDTPLEDFLVAKAGGEQYVANTTVILKSYTPEGNAAQDMETIFNAGAAGFFATDSTEYNAWGASWADFVDAVQAWKDSR